MKKFIVIVFLGLFMVAPQVEAITNEEALIILQQIKADVVALQAEVSAYSDTGEVLGVSEEGTSNTLTTALNTLTVETAGSGTFNFFNVLTDSEAAKKCEEIAYNSNYSRQLITCTYNNKILYNAVFLAG